MRFFLEKYWPVIMLKLDLSDISSWLNIFMQTWPDWHRSDSVLSMQHIRRYMVSMYITVSYVNFVTWYYLLSFSTVNLIFLLILIKNIFCRDSLRLFLIILFHHFYHPLMSFACNTYHCDICHAGILFSTCIL